MSIEIALENKIEKMINEKIQEIGGYPELLNLKEASEYAGVSKHTMRQVLYQNREEVESSFRNPQGFVNYPSDEYARWLINRRGLDQWLNSNTYKVKVK